jgi:hypothetical protein
VEREWKAGRGFALRFHAYGKRYYVTLGLARDGWTRAKAEVELANVLADVRRASWIPPGQRPARVAATAAPAPLTFGVFARQ